MFTLDNRNLTWSYDNYIGDDYYIFVIGYDILSCKFAEEDMPCDDAFEIASQIWESFKMFEKANGTKDCSTYEALWEFADEYIDNMMFGEEEF